MHSVRSQPRLRPMIGLILGLTLIVLWLPKRTDAVETTTSYYLLPITEFGVHPPLPFPTHYPGLEECGGWLPNCQVLAPGGVITFTRDPATGVAHLDLSQVMIPPGIPSQTAPSGALASALFQELDTITGRLVAIGDATDRWAFETAQGTVIGVSDIVHGLGPIYLDGGFDHRPFDGPSVNISLEGIPVPEPGFVTSCIVGLTGLSWAARIRRRKYT